MRLKLTLHRGEGDPVDIVVTTDSTATAGDVARHIAESDPTRTLAFADGSTLTAKHVIYSGTVWNLYEKLLPGELLRKGELERVKSLVPTYPSVVLYALVDKSAIPEGTAAVEMLANPDTLDEREVTVYIPSVDDRTLCEEDCHVIMAIGPSFDTWNRADKKDYLKKKEHEKARLLHVLESRFPGISRAVRLTEIATPATIERYTLKTAAPSRDPSRCWASTC